jgi:gamma-glutamylcyclotransferase (GGCT)/AIG2-like uncharacterized protein YtfP
MLTAPVGATGSRHRQDGRVPLLPCSPSPDMNVFTYGSLMFPEVWERVTGLCEPGLPATLAHHIARRIQGQSYPALIAWNGAATTGILYEKVTAAALAALDAFEGTFYDRVTLEVSLPDGTARSAWVYRAARPDDPAILSEVWEAGPFEKEDLAAFLRSDPGFLENGRD